MVFAARWGWLPPNVNSAYGEKVDFLYLVIMGLVGVLFILTEGFLLWSVLRYRSRPGRKAVYTHGSKKVEILWSIAPGAILLWLALYQMSSWKEIRIDFPDEARVQQGTLLVVQAFPEQFNWNFRYPGPNGTFGEKQANDDCTTSQLFVPLDKDVLVKETAKDVIHSFFLPHARVKQDAMPGLLTKVWFRIGKLPCWNLARQRAGEAYPLEFLTEAEFKAKRVAWIDSSLHLAGFEFKDWQKELQRNKLETDMARRALEGKAGPEAEGIRKKLQDLEREREGIARELQTHRYSYVPEPDAKTCKVLSQGQEAEAPTTGAAAPEYVLHYYEIACAELCGLGHFQMRSELHVLPKAQYDAWAKVQGKKGNWEKFEKIWDRYYDDYNHPAKPAVARNP